MASPVPAMIVGQVGAEPGITKSQLGQELDLAWSTIDYHVNRLESEGELERLPLLRRVHLFRAEYPLELRQPISVLRHARAGAIAGALDSRDAAICELAHELKASRKVIARHVRHLRDAGAAEEVLGPRPRFRLTGVGRRLLDRIRAD